MRVAVVHYHLKRGGVTRVVESAMRGLADLGANCVAIAGQIPEDFAFKASSVELPCLRYSNEQADTPDAHQIVEQLRTTAREALGADPDIWHIHNHSLGKNSALPEVVDILADSGARLLLQMHDFAEDGRPANYQLNQSSDASARLYPDAPHVHYGVLNGRDFEIFKSTQLAPERLHILPNPISAAPPSHTQDHAPILDALQAERLILYPVRAVRRKNFGEMLLWAALAQEGDVFATTLGPTNQNFAAPYARWRHVAEQHALPIRFAIGESRQWSFEAIMDAAAAILTTSIAEGFGLAYLEPWLFGKSIIGRDLPSITQDFKAEGITLDHLYATLPIPRDWIRIPALEEALHQGLTAAYTAYASQLPSDAVERALKPSRPPPARSTSADSTSPSKKA